MIECGTCKTVTYDTKGWFLMANRLWLCPECLAKLKTVVKRPERLSKNLSKFLKKHEKRS